MQPTTETSQCEACCAFCLYILVYSLSSVCEVRPKMGLCVHVCDIGSNCYDVC